MTETRGTPERCSTPVRSGPAHKRETGLERPCSDKHSSLFCGTSVGKKMFYDVAVSPFGEEKHSAVSLRVQSRKNRRTPVNIVEMPRPKSRPRRDAVSAASLPSSEPFYMFFRCLLNNYFTSVTYDRSKISLLH